MVRTNAESSTKSGQSEIKHKRILLIYSPYRQSLNIRRNPESTNSYM